LKKEVEDFLCHCKQNLIHNGQINFGLAVTYIASVPAMYASDIEYRLLFDWHFSPEGRQLQKHEVHELFDFQRYIASLLGNTYGLNYQFWQFFVFHAIANVKGKTLLEIGGSLPNDMLFDLFGVGSYINTESPDYISAESGESYTAKHGNHEKRRTIFRNAEELEVDLPRESIDLIFSVACFEHIYDLESALRSCHAVQQKGGLLYSFFAPIYSYLTDGHHGVIPSHSKFNETPWGLHLLSHEDQRKYLQTSGITDPKEIQEFLGAMNFDRIPNRLYYEDYARILVESPYYVVRLDNVAPNYNISKKYPSEVARVRDSNLKIRNLNTQGFRVLLQKA
jgi:SAM-dependent methyltransferase